MSPWLPPDDDYESWDTLDFAVVVASSIAALIFLAQSLLMIADWIAS